MLGPRDGGVRGAQGAIQEHPAGRVEEAGRRIDQVDPEIGQERDPVRQGDPGRPEEGFGPEGGTELGDRLDERPTLGPLRAGVAPDQQVRVRRADRLLQFARQGGAHEDRVGADRRRAPERADDLRGRHRVLEVERPGTVRDLEMPHTERSVDRSEHGPRGRPAGGPALEQPRYEQRDLPDGRAADEGQPFQPLDGSPHDS